MKYEYDLLGEICALPGKKPNSMFTEEYYITIVSLWVGLYVLGDIIYVQGVNVWG